MAASRFIDMLPEKSHLANELLSLGVTPARIKMIESVEEMDSLVDTIKQNYVKEYRMAYAQSGSQSEIVVA
jgi:hypothetical protein